LTSSAPDRSERLRAGALLLDLLRSGDHAAFHVRVGHLHGEKVATAIVFDWGPDCGIYNVGTLEDARRGLGAAFTLVQPHDALERGCQTASLQSTPMAERIYAAVGVRDVGRLLAYTR
jgi:hypothetical protein